MIHQIFFAGARLVWTEHVTKYPPTSAKRYSAIFKPYSHKEKSSYQI